LGKDVSDGKAADNKGALEIPLTKNSVIVADRYYFDSYLLNKWDSGGVFFVIRTKENIKYRSFFHIKAKGILRKWEK